MLVKKRVVTLHQYVVPGTASTPDCPPKSELMDYYATSIVAQENSKLPIRPSRRSKPKQLLFSPTAYGPFWTEIQKYKTLQNIWDNTSWNCRVPGQARTIIRNEAYNRVQPQWVYPPENTADPDVILNLMNQIKSHRCNMAESIGEWRETARAVEGGADGLRNAYRFVRSLAKTPRKKWPRKFKRLWENRDRIKPGDVPGAYLMTQFGILPYLQLANDASQALIDTGTKPLVKVFRARAEKVEEWGSADWIYAKRTRSANGVAVVEYKPDLGNFTPGNIGEALWASLPLSFMVDYFIGIGSWLSAIDALSGVGRYAGTISVRETYRCTDNIKPGAWPIVVEPGRVSRRAYKRGLLSFPVVPPLPQWRTSSSFGKLTSSLAILYQLRKST